MKRLGSLLGAMVLLSLAVPGVADSILYSNGPINGQAHAFGIGPVSNSFTLAHQSDLKSMSLGIWVFNTGPEEGQIAGELRFGIGTSPFGTNLASGVVTGKELTSRFLFVNVHHVEVFETSFNFPSSIDLAAGTYWITLFDGSAVNGNPLAWDTNFGPSQAFFARPGDRVDSQAFTLYGTVPEPGTLTLLGTGLLGIVGAIRRKRF